MRVKITIGAPLDFSRYEGMENDRYILRAITARRTPASSRSS